MTSSQTFSSSSPSPGVKRKEKLDAEKTKEDFADTKTSSLSPGVERKEKLDAENMKEDFADSKTESNKDVLGRNASKALTERYGGNYFVPDKKTKKTKNLKEMRMKKKEMTKDKITKKIMKAHEVRGNMKKEGSILRYFFVKEKGLDKER